MTDKKICNQCLEPKPLSDFYATTDGHKDGVRSSCKECVNVNSSAWHKANPEKVRAKTSRWRKNNPEKAREMDAEQNKKRDKERSREWHLQSAFGITQEDYSRMHEEQNGCCAICGTNNPGGKWFHVDHDHKSGAVRGLLCLKCNAGIGLMSDSTSILEKAISYLKGN